MRGTKRKMRNLLRVRKQKDVIRDVMLSAGQCGTWLTLDELAKLTQFPPASISAQLRHLRKPQNGAFDVEKRVRRVARALRGDGFGTVWEYRVWRGLPRSWPPRRRGPAPRRATARTVKRIAAGRLALQPAGL